MRSLRIMQGMHDTIAPQPDHRRLFEVASAQHGYFTTSQATACGIGWASLSRGAATGRYRRIRRGVYRLRDFPSTSWEEIMSAWLAAGADSAVVSHASALALLGLGDIVPDRVHLTVPRSRRALSIGPGVAIHTSTRTLPPTDITIHNGIRVTSPARTLIDVATTGIDPDHLARAIRQAIAHGWTSAEDLRARANEHGPMVRLAIHSATHCGAS